MNHPPETGFHSIQAHLVKGEGSVKTGIEGSEAADTLKKKVNEEKDDCYHKVKARYDVWPSAYASGALSKCRKVGAKNWGNKSKD
jgi:hypothetical protein